MQGAYPSHVIFDLDGTLLDTEPLYTQAAQALVGRYGKTFTWELKRKTMGGAAHKSAAIVVEELQLPMSPEAYLAERNQVLEKLFLDVPAIPGAEQLVRALHRHGSRLAIATSSERRLCELKLDKHPWASLFDVIVCSDDPGVEQAKPAPDLFLHAARGLGVDPTLCVAVEDSPKGAQAALAAHMTVVARVDPHLDVEAFAGCHRIVRDFAELDLSELAPPVVAQTD